MVFSRFLSRGGHPTEILQIRTFPTLFQSHLLQPVSKRSRQKQKSLAFANQQTLFKYMPFGIAFLQRYFTFWVTNLLAV